MSRILKIVGGISMLVLAMLVTLVAGCVHLLERDKYLRHP
jgi:hypothetical protein